ncbi:MAG: flagellar protein FlgN [FCB group bacterium]|nr:flagellar protein FlgN [FCB group bacterium]
MTETSSNNQDFCLQLIEGLKRETDTYRQLNAILKKKQKAIIDGDLETLHACVEEEQGLVKSGLKEAELRKNLMCDFLHISDGTGTAPRLSDIISAVSGEHQTQLINLRYHLKQEVDRISKLNSENSFLLNSSISHIKGLINIFLKCDQDSPKLYDNDGITKNLENENKILNCTI